MPRVRHYTDEEAAWIAETAPSYTNSRVMAEAYEGRFGRRMPPVTLRTYCRKHGIEAGWQGSRQMSAVHRTRGGNWRVCGVKMTDPQHDWWLAHGELPPKGTNVLRATDGMELATDAELMAINSHGLAWTDRASLRACIGLARVIVAHDRAVRSDPEYARERRRAMDAGYARCRRSRLREEREGRRP